MPTSLRILIVEDREDDALLVLNVLRQGLSGPLDHMWVATKADLRAALVAKPWDIIVSDYHLPGMTGLDTLAARDALRPDIPIIIMTGTGNEEIASDVMKAGAQDYVTKGHPQRLVPAIQRAIAEVETRRALRETALRLDQVLHSLPIVVYLARASGDFGRLWVSPNTEAVTGFPPGRFVEQSDFWASRLHPDDRDRTLREFEAAAAAGSARLEYRWQRADGSYRWFLSCATVQRDAQGRPEKLVGLMMDVSEHKRLEEQYLQAQKMEAVGRLAGGVAHDFNNLLTIIAGYSQILLGLIPSGDPMHGYAEEIRSAGQRAAELTRQLLSFSRRQVLQPRVIDLNGVIAGMEKMLRRIIGEDVRLVAAPAKDLGRVRADPGQIEQILLNLAVNARDAMPKGGKITIETANVAWKESCTAAGEAGHRGPCVMLAVSDTGYGMPPEVKARLFEPFFTTKEIGKGTGLGLATVYGIVQQSGGHVSVYSEVGKGTTFKIYLPRVDEAAEALPKAAETAVPRGTETVLLAEDEDRVRVLLREFLRTADFTILEAADGEKALQAFKDHAGPVHVLVTDTVMPGLDGVELARQVAALRPQMKTIYMSGYADRAAVHHAKIPEGAPFLQKPFTPDVLARKIRELLDSKGRESGSGQGPGANAGERP